VKRSTAKSGMALEPFNGSDAMLSIRQSVEEKEAVAPHLAIFTVRVAGDAVWSRTITIPLFLEKRQAGGTTGA
jgi:hypothetical protein